MILPAFLVFLFCAVSSIPVETGKKIDETTPWLIPSTTMMIEPIKTERPILETTVEMKTEIPMTTMAETIAPTTIPPKSDESKSSEEKDSSTTLMTTAAWTEAPTTPAKEEWMSTTMKKEVVKKTATKKGCTHTKTLVEKATSMPFQDAEAIITTAGDSPQIALQFDAKSQIDEPLIVSTVTRMTDDMQRDAVSAAREGFQLFKDNEYLVAKHIVTTFDAKYGPYWHCSAGESYEAYFTFEKDTFIRMSKGKIHVQLYKHFCSE